MLFLAHIQHSFQNVHLSEKQKSTIVCNVKQRRMLCLLAPADPETNVVVVGGGGGGVGNKRENLFVTLNVGQSPINHGCSVNIECSTVVASTGFNSSSLFLFGPFTLSVATDNICKVENHP